MSLRAIFKPDYERYDGVRPINIYLLRLLFGLVILFVGSMPWGYFFKTYVAPRRRSSPGH